VNYEKFRCWRDRVASERALLRLDCMNPAKALDHLIANPSKFTSYTDLSTLPVAWKTVLGLKVINDDRLVIGTGVRDILRVLFDVLTTESLIYWLPRDVYPVYWNLLGNRNAVAFSTIPTFNMNFLDDVGFDACVLLPSPLTPTGRSLTTEEAKQLYSWLELSPRRWLILDSVYNFDFPIQNAALAELVSNHRCITIFSTSKSWLSPQTAGVAIVPPILHEELQKGVTQPNNSQRCLAAHLLLERPEFPSILQHRFKQQWERLRSQIQLADPLWQPPQTGYFSIVQTASQQLCDQFDILSVPASVFGSDETDASAITCLFDMKAQDIGK